MQTTTIATRANQTLIARVPFSVSALIICVIATAVVNVATVTIIETGAHASVSLYANLFLASLLLTSLTLTGLARLAGLRSLVGLTTTRLATSTA